MTLSINKTAPVEEETIVSAAEDAPPHFQHYGNGQYDDSLVNEKVENSKANRELRWAYAYKAHELAVKCIYFWMAVIAVHALVLGVTGKTLISDNVFIAITTGVTVNVLAAFLGVIRGLFPSETAEKSN